VAVEPQPHAYKALLASLKANGFKNVVAVRKAISSALGSLKFAISSFSNWSRVNVSKRKDDIVEEIDVETSTVDVLVSELGLRRLDLVRMDLEGYEEEVIRGMREAIDKFRPAICMELHICYFGLERSIALLAGLMKMGYRILFAAPRLFDFYPSRLLPMRFTRGATRSDNFSRSLRNPTCAKSFTFAFSLMRSKEALPPSMNS
jgi:FkbM family methyltransferase